MTEINKKFFEKEKPEISERESEELSKKALEIFNAKLDSIEEYKEPKKEGNITIIKKADAIIYQIESKNLKIPGLRQWEMPFEIGLGDPKDMKPGYIHFDIRREIEKEIKEEIEEKTSCLLQLDEKKEINLLLDSRWYESFAPLLTTGLLKNFQEMLDRYQIKKIWVFGEGENKEIFEEIEKMVLDDQISAYAKKQGMTNTEFLRWRLIGAKLGEVYESKK